MAKAKYTAFEGDIFSTVRDTDRIKILSTLYKDSSIRDAFSDYYGMKLTNVSKEEQEKLEVDIMHLTVGDVFYAPVSEFTDRYIYFDVPGVKDEVVSKENFKDCRVNIENYLLNHHNTLAFKVMSHDKGKYNVSIIEGYYQIWQAVLKSNIKNNVPVTAHIDGLVTGGYNASLTITTLNELTGRNYTSMAFIPGSQIVLNIEHDFSRWIDEDVECLPINIVEFKKNNYTGEVEYSVILSRKRLLQQEGMFRLYEIWQTMQLADKFSDKDKVTGPYYDGVVTGIINSNKKKGMFIELDGMQINGLLPMHDVSDMLNYKTGDVVNVRIKYLEKIDQSKPLFIMKHDVPVKCNCRPVFSF